MTNNKTKENKMTDLEKKVYDFINENTNEEDMECIDITDLTKGLNESAKVLRGVIASLVKKGMVWVETFDSNFVTQYFYWIS
jgi:predicted transcriptional regulator